MVGRDADVLPIEVLLVIFSYLSLEEAAVKCLNLIINSGWGIMLIHFGTQNFKNIFLMFIQN